MSSGILVFYRWPRDTRLAFAPVCVQEVLAAATVKRSEEYEILCVRIGKQQQQQQVPAGVRMPAEDARLASKSSAFTLIHVTIEDVALVDLMDRSFDRPCLLCRYDNSHAASDISGHDHARSAVAWLPGIRDPVELATADGELATLNTLINSGLPFAPALVKSMLACAEALAAEVIKEKKTRHSNNKAIEELQRAVQTVQSNDAGNVAVCALSRVHEPSRLVSEFLAVEPAVPERVESFAAVISDTANIKRMELLRPGFANPQQSTGSALKLLLHQWKNTAVDTLGNGRACWPRSGRFRIPADPKKRKAAGTKIIFHQDGTNRPEDVKKDETGKSSGMWVALYNQVVRWIDLPTKPTNAKTLMYMGRVVFVTSVDPRCKTATVAPRIESLPRIVGSPFELRVEDEPLPADDEYHLVLTVLLEDLHRYFYTYESYCRILQSVTRVPTLGALSLASASSLNLTQSNAYGVLRSFFGLAPQGDSVHHAPSIHDVLGLPRSIFRAGIMKQVEERMGKTFSAAQRSFFMELEMPTAVLDCVPGAGKTTLLVGVALAVSLRSNAGVKIIVTEPNKVMVETVYNVYREFLGDRFVARAGLNDASGHDHLEEFLEAKVDQATECDTEIIAAVDRCIELLSNALCFMFAPEERCKDESGAALLLLYCELLARRHAYLTTRFYALQSQAREKAIKDCLVFVLTSSLMQKLNAGCLADALSEHFNDGSSRWWYQCDEYQQEPYPRLGASLAGTDAAILVGDPAQIEHTEGRSGNIGGAIAVGADARRPARSFDLQLVTDWLRDNDAVQKFTSSGTRRIGPTMVEVINTALPEHFHELVSEKNHVNDTLYLPVVFQRLCGWVHRENHARSPGSVDSDSEDSGKLEAQREPHFFAHACTVVALEMVCLRQRTCAVTPVDGVIIMAFLNSLLDAFQLYLIRCLQDVCAEIHACAELPALASSDVYDYQACCRDSLIKLSSVRAAGGVDKSVSVLLGAHRRRGDHSWAGDCLMKSQIGVALSRASRRCYAFIEDQSAEVVTAHSGPVRQEGKGLGLAYVDTASRDMDPHTKKGMNKRANQARSQLPWVRLVRQSEIIWKTSLAIPPEWRCILDSSACYPSPIWQSPVWLDALAADGAEHVVQCFRRPGHEAAQLVLDAAWEGYEGMEWVREASDPKPLKSGSKSKSVTEVLDGSGSILSAALLEDVNASRDPAPIQFREDVTKIYRLSKRENDSDSEPEGAPETGFIRRTWRKARINCMTIHVRGKSDVLVMVPVATLILTPHGTVDGLPWHSGDQAEWNASWLLRAMFEEFEDVVREHMPDDSLRTSTVFHKMDVVDFKDGCSTSIRSAGSDRPAFVMERDNAPDDADGQWSKIIHVYPAMGLPKQHRGQQALLARCYNPLVAQVFAAVAQQWLQMRMYTSQIVRAFPKRMPSAEQESVFNEFLKGLDSHLYQARLDVPGGRALSDFHVSEDCVGSARAGYVWGDIDEFVRVVCGPEWSNECDVAAPLVDRAAQLIASGQ